MNVEMIYPPPGDHVPQAERNNRLIGERIRTIYHRLPFNRLPTEMWKHLIQAVVQQINLVPADHGVSDFFSPWAILQHRKLDFKRHSGTTFGSYVQAHQDNNPTNDNSSRVIDTIYLRPTLGTPGGHYLLNLATGAVVIRQRFWEIPITDIVIKAVNKMGAKQGFKSLKLEDRDNVQLLPVDWRPGVDFEGEIETDQDSHAEDSSDDSDDGESDDDSEAVSYTHLTLPTTSRV